MPASSKEFLDIQATIECGFTLKCIRDVTRTYHQMHCTDKYSQQSSIIWPVLHILQGRSSLTFRQLWNVDSLWNMYMTWQEHTVKCTVEITYLLYPNKSFTYNFKTARKKMEQLPIDSYMLLCKQKNSISINKSLTFNLLAI